MGTAMSLELDAGMEEALDRYEKDILFQISTLSITAKDEEEDPATDSDFEQSPKVCLLSRPISTKRDNSSPMPTCVTALFEGALRDESLCPPQCCTTPITLEDAEEFIDHKLATKYRKRVVELLDPDRTYCSEPTCSRYIPQKSTRSHRVVCQCKCGAQTCRKCKQKAHGELGDCVRHFDSLLENLAKVKGWKRCPNCSRLTELSLGCFHIRCICDFEWCYSCGKEWGSCECVLWEEYYLLDHES
ncbi:hypothetical protein N7541_005579 [Penicillium brevicompactum]|uniref:RBR-type E3 ubiquitin transferase n=1 Tax=Penicillium brevicompactum TaxID=5074 RepID=A0A9W9UT56_PENBR|nr:hypothetical protein N7541_005579 [Penicillium brevicompactum]